jgi:predicted pyridoxine 5'-phosphate oxidase superfamily flavin-nucleotide-binding protein
MTRSFFDLAFTPAVMAEQQRRGSRAGYAHAAETSDDTERVSLSEQEVNFIAARDSFYLASVSETGWPYVQHRGGPIGFVRRVDNRTLGWAEYVGNRQYVSFGNLSEDDRVAIIFMDYPRRHRLKVLGHARSFELAERPDLTLELAVDHYKARIERLMIVTVAAFDWNCPQHITPRFSLDEIQELVSPLRAKIAELEERVALQREDPR